MGGGVRSSFEKERGLERRGKGRKGRSGGESVTSGEHVTVKRR